MIDNTWGQQPAVERFMVPERLNSQLQWADKSQNSIHTSHDTTHTRACVWLMVDISSQALCFYHKNIHLKCILCLSLDIIWILHFNMMCIQVLQHPGSLHKEEMMMVRMCNWKAEAVKMEWNKIWRRLVSHWLCKCKSNCFKSFFSFLNLTNSFIVFSFSQQINCAQN